jgi:hypothetical protein
MKLRSRNKRRRVERQEEAITRAAAIDERTPEQQLEVLTARGHGARIGQGMALRETLRLTDVINEYGYLEGVRLA